MKDSTIKSLELRIKDLKREVIAYKIRWMNDMKWLYLYITPASFLSGIAIGVIISQIIILK